MKALLFFCLLFTASIAMAKSKAQYKILEGKLHKGGTAFTEVLPDPNLFRVKMGYEIIKKAWAPISSEFLKGERMIDLPVQFKDERGYLELESHGSMTIPDGHIKFIRRTVLGDKHDAYEVLVLPKNGKAKIELVYHPDLPSVGWGRMKITFISHIPLLNGYEMMMEL